jgi:prefoldin subunit 5
MAMTEVKVDGENLEGFEAAEELESGLDAGEMPEKGQGESSEVEGTEEDEDDLIVSIGEEQSEEKEEANPPAPKWVKDLRKSHRELQRENRELKAKLTTGEKGAEKLAPLGKKPTLEDLDYDAEKYEEALTDWFEKKRTFETELQKAKQAEKEQENAWNERLEGYRKAKGSLKVRDFEEAEALVEEHLSTQQQGIILHGAEKPELLVYALGKNPKKAKELAAITDPLKFAFAVAKLEKDLKVSTRKPSTQPEKPITGTGKVSGSVDSALERLRAEADKTGDYSKVIAYKNQKRK